jgi:hypothetical protein
VALSRAFWGGANRFGFRLVHYSVQGHHIHFLIEAEDPSLVAVIAPDTFLLRQLC